MTLCLFADDTILFIESVDPIATANTLNSNLLKITTWANKWLVKFNSTKTKSLCISRKVNYIHHPPLFMYTQMLTEVRDHKHLGIFLASDLSWHKHIKYIKYKAWQRINIMRKLKYILNRLCLETICMSFVRPILEYGDIIFDNCTQQEK